MLSVILFLICFNDGQTLSWYTIVIIFLSINISIFSAYKRCSVLCKGTYTTKNERYDDNKTHCVGFSIRFNLDNKYPTKLRDFPCGISRCILEVIDFECVNETLINRNHGRGTAKCTGNLNFELIQLLVVTVTPTPNIIHSFVSHIFLKIQW